MNKSAKVIIGALLFWVTMFAGGYFFLQPGALAAPGDPPARQTELVVSFTKYHWWLTRWSDNLAVCGVDINHKGVPTTGEIYDQCGETLYSEYVTTPPCEGAAVGDTSDCIGLYVYLASTFPDERTVIVDLPVPSVTIALTGCNPMPPENECRNIPSMVFTAEEPLPNEFIESIHIEMDGQVYECPGHECVVPLGVTPIEGSDVVFWANSSYGDTTERYTGRVRILDGGVSLDARPVWFVDVLSTQWRGSVVSSCSAAWEAFPPVGGLPVWLSSPDSFEGLSTDIGFVYLAGQFIQQGVVDASNCPANGLVSNGIANQCGLRQARELVNLWQDHFDPAIVEASQRTNIPAQLLKNLFAQESQFWPTVTQADEYGLGQLTSQGADTPLLWNTSFYQQFCPLVLHEETCETGYAQLELNEQELLRGALASRADSRCSDCEFGIDLSKAQLSVDIFAETLKANCDQVSVIVFNTTGGITPGVVSTYEDLWRFTLVNYNGGPGCLINALRDSWTTGSGSTLSWSEVSTDLPESCETARNYVDMITRDRPFGNPDFVPTPMPTPAHKGASGAGDSSGAEDSSDDAGAGDEDGGGYPPPVSATATPTPTPTPNPYP